MSSKRTLEERIHEKDAQWQKAIAKARQYEKQKRQLERQKSLADRKQRNHRLIEIGACAESVLGRAFRDGDNIRFLIFLKQQEKNGGYFTKAMEKDLPQEREGKEKVADSAPLHETNDSVSSSSITA